MRKHRERVGIDNSLVGIVGIKNDRDCGGSFRA